MGGFNAFLLGTTVVILVFHFEEGIVRIEVFADADLLSDLSPSLMQMVHPVVWGVKVDGVIARSAFTISTLHKIIGCRNVQQRGKL